MQNGFKIHTVDITGSTNDDALSCFENKSVFVAKRQTGGKGRRGRSWQSEEGNLFATVLYTISKKDMDFIGCYSLAAAVSVGEAISVLSPSLNISYKWSNDVLLNDKKVCGILLETAEDPFRLAIGTGVNITNHPQGLLNYEATDIHEQGAKNINRDNLLEAYLEFLDFHIKLINSGEAEKITEKWLSKCNHLHQPIKVMLANRMVYGLFKGLDAKGNLILSNLDELNAKDLIIPAGEVLF